MEVGNIVRINEETLASFEQMMIKNSNLLKFFSKTQGIVTKIEKNKLQYQPNILTVKHTDGFEQYYLETSLEIVEKEEITTSIPKKFYRMTVSGESSGTAERYLSETEYNLIDSIFNEMSEYATYENLTIEEINE